MQGFSNEEIAEQMHYTINYIYTLIKIAIQEDIWFSKEEIIEFKKKRFEREAVEELSIKGKREETAGEQHEPEKKKRRNLRRYTEEYKRLKRIAKEEDRWEYKGAENVSLRGREQFAEYLIKLYQLGANISKEDIEIILNAIGIHPEFANKERLKLLILGMVRSEGMAQAERMVTTLIRELGNTPFQEPLWEYKKWLSRQRLIPKITEMKRNGCNNTEIGERLGISSAEVMIFLERAKDRPEFFEEESR